MKKILLIAALAIGFTSQAQLPANSPAPDFTVTDLNGNTHHLNDYLAQGKTVILDISAAWCGPCWAYHNSGSLDDVYETFGQGGSDEVVVLFVEGDSVTPVEMLYGTGTDEYGRVPQGNWVENTPYPIIDSGLIADLYEITYFPTVYRICPDGIVNEIGSASATSIRNGINSNCVTTPLVGLSNFPHSNATEFRSCVNSGALVTKVRNLGTNTMTSATIVLKENGNPIETKNWTGNTTQFNTATITFTSATLTPGATYVAEVTSVNGGSPLHPEQAIGDIAVNLAQVATSTELTLNIFTDEYPEEIKWRVKNGAGTVIANGGPYEGENSTMITETFSVPAGTADDCYRFELQDTYGDGWGIGATQHGVQIFNGDALIFEKFTNDAFTTLPVLAAFKTQVVLGVGEFDSNAFAIYPNPSNGLFNIRTTSSATILVSDLTGKTVYSGSNINDGAVLDLTALQTGMYIAKVKTATTETVEKLIIK
ncbi:TlpA family protein disulfide reductase [Flavobacterium silvaticum]|uniref:T9SS type A sorting domain-containing protein n=1 Tax=Flavobacterium silvaticum TaxID=1852020 RepID=A0A972JG27_9FLAO|nr:T9SS type A sorting domain-containing protein [Flavobacterium silvaticum]NMH28604.1 T9SS type A sorting domain-containing protein [Flavobacterium silvaticum]